MCRILVGNPERKRQRGNEDQRRDVNTETILTFEQITICWQFEQLSASQGGLFSVKSQCHFFSSEALQFV